MSLSNNDLPLIYALPKGVNFWRIDWFGELAFPNRMIRRTQPSLLLHLSRIADEKFGDDPSILLSPESTTPARYQRKVWVSVGTLPLLRIGDVWRDGKLEARPDYQLETFDDLLIDKSTTSLIKSGLKLNDEGFLLPLVEHPWHLHCTQSYCVMVELPDQRRLIIPCVELIRFYFGSSSNLVTKLFMPPLERKTLYSNPKFDRTTGRLSLELAERISGASAADIGRLHLDPFAWRAAAHVGASALSASLNRQSIYVQALFPFEGITSLVAAGKWLSYGDHANSTFIVYNLRSCSHPFPFLSLRYETKAKRQDQRRDKDDSRGSTNRPYHSSAVDDPDQKIVEQDASSHLASKVRTTHSEPRFPDLRKKSIWKNKELLSSKNDPAPIHRQGNSVGSEAVGIPGSERRVRAIDLAILTGQNSDHQPAPEFLQRTVEELKQLREICVELLTHSEEDGWSIPITIISDEDGVIDMRLFIEDGDFNTRLRRVSAFSVRFNCETIYVVAIESSPIHVKIYASSENDAHDLWQTIDCAAADFLHRPEVRDEDIIDLIHWIFDLQTLQRDSCTQL